MCGFVGFSGDFDTTALPEALAAIQHRGPDDTGIFIEAAHRVALGHCRLSVIDTSAAGHQPMMSTDGSFVLVFNGEIYNFLDLKADLEEKGVRFRGNSDTEVVLELFLADGINMLSRLNGMFALAIFDRVSGDLWIARDGSGVKPLYVGQSARGLCFSSEIKGLIPFFQDQPVTFDADTLHRLLTFLWCPGNGTLLREIRKLAPGEFMHIRDGILVEQRRWHLPPQARVAVCTGASAEVVIDAVRGRLREAVRRQLVADVPVGAFLSGGLDSSAVAAFAREFVPDLRCLTIETTGDQDSGIDSDLPYARQVATYLGLELETVPIDPSMISDEIETMIWHLDEPLADPAALGVLLICRKAQERGIKVMLSGVGGDDLFTGYRRHLALRYDGLWNWLPAFARRSTVTLTDRLNQRSALGRQLSRLARTIAADRETALAHHFIWAQRSDLMPLYSPEFYHKIKHVEAIEPLVKYAEELSPLSSKIDRILALEQRFFLADHNLIYTDKMSMACGVEVRVPFLDNDLVALAARIPDSFKQRGHVGKWVLKKAMRDLLPDNVVHRRKTGFGVPLRRWVRQDLADLVSQYLSKKRLEERGIFDAKMVHKLINDNRSGNIDYSYTIFSLLCIEIWCSKFGTEAGLTINYTGVAS